MGNDLRIGLGGSIRFRSLYDNLATNIIVFMTNQPLTWSIKMYLFNFF